MTGCETHKHIDGHFPIYLVHVHVAVGNCQQNLVSNPTQTYNSSKQRIGDPIASHSASNKQTWENDFSPPDRVLAPRPALSLVLSGSTCCNELAFLHTSVPRRDGTYLQV